MINRVKYNEFSSEVKDEISRYHEKMKSKGDVAITFENSIKIWFEEEFDDWLFKRFPKSGDNNRKFVRVDVELPIKISETLIDAQGDDEAEIIGEILNLSRGGLYFSSTKPFSESSIIKVIIDLAEVSEDLSEVEALAMVMRVEKSGNSYGIGLMFSTIYDNTKEAIDMLLFKNLSYFLYQNK